MPKKDSNKYRMKLAEKAARRKKRKQLRLEKAKKKNKVVNRNKNLIAQLKQQEKPSFNKNAFMSVASNNTRVKKEEPKVFDKVAWKPPESTKEDISAEPNSDQISFDKSAWQVN